MTNFQKNFNELKKLRAMFIGKLQKKVGIDFGEICKEHWCKF